MVVPPVPGRVYRQLSKGGDPIYVDLERSPPVSSAALLPSKQDTDGLSLIDFDTRSEVWASHRLESPREQRYVVLIDVSMIEEVAKECSIDHAMLCSPDELDNNFGIPFSHWLAVRINIDDYKDNVESKKKIKSWAKLVASRLSKESLSKLQPLPSYTHQYRPAFFKFRSIQNRLGEIAIRWKLVFLNRLQNLTDANKATKKGHNK